MSRGKAVKVGISALFIAIVSINLLYYVAAHRLTGAETKAFVSNSISEAHGILSLKGTDSWGPMLAVREWLLSGQRGDPYQHFFFERGLKFQYPLSSLLFILWVPTGTEGVRILNISNILAWLGIMVSMGLLILRFNRITSDKESRIQPRFLVLTTTCSAILFLPVTRAMYLGQIQILLDAMFVVASYLLASDMPRLAGIMMGASALIKPQMALFLLWGAFRRKTSFVLSASVVLCFGYLASGLLFGWYWPLEYLRVLGFIARHGESFYANQSVNGLVNRALGNGTNLTWDAHNFAPFNRITYTLTCLSTILFIIVGVLVGRRSEPVSVTVLSFVIAGICFTCASPVAWEHHYGVLLPGFALCFVAMLESRLEKSRRTIAMVLSAVIFLIAASPEGILNLTAQTPANVLQSYLFLCALGLLSLLIFYVSEFSRAIDLGSTTGRGAPYIPERGV